MSKLIYAHLDRMKKDKVFYLCLASMLAAGLFVAIKSEVALDRVFFSYTLVIGLVSAVFIGLFIGTEHGDGTMRNKLIVAHTKSQVYLSNLIVSLLSGIPFCIVFLIPLLVIGIPRLGYFQMSSFQALELFGITLVLSFAYSSIFTMISMITSNKAVTAVSCILSFLALLAIAAVLFSALHEPEYIDSYVTSLTGPGKMQHTLNPHYLTGKQRNIYQFFLDLLPSGQTYQFVEMDLLHTWQLPVYSFILVALSSLIGVAVFRKKDLK